MALQSGGDRQQKAVGELGADFVDELRKVGLRLWSWAAGLGFYHPHRRPLLLLFQQQEFRHLHTFLNLLVARALLDVKAMPSRIRAKRHP